MKFDVRSAIQFAAVAEELSFRKAAERLRVAQPWLSTRIRKLEEQLGFTLLLRSTRKLELTEAGRVFLGDAAALAAAARAAEQSANMLRNRQAGRIRIGVPPYHGSLLQKTVLIREFSTIRPAASVELDVGWSLHLIDRLLERSVDLAFILDCAVDPDLEALTVGRYESLLAIRSDEPLARLATLTRADLRDCKLAVFTRGLNPPLFDKLYAPLEAAGARLLQVPEFADLDVDRHGKNQFPVFPTLACVGRPAIHNPDLVVRRLTDYSVQIPLQLVRRKAWTGKLQEDFWELARNPRPG